MKRNSLQRLAMLAAELPEDDLSDVLNFAERLHQRECSGCFWARNSVVKRDLLQNLDVRFCRIEALAEQLDRLSDNNDRIQLGAIMLLLDEVQLYRTLLDNLDI